MAGRIPTNEYLWGILSDVHAEDERLSRALFFMRSQGVGTYIFAGDAVDGRGDAEQCCSMLRAVGALAVRGNHDRWLLEGNNGFLFDMTPIESLSKASLEWLQDMPASREILCCDERILLCHGVGDDDMCALRIDDTGYSLSSNLKLQEVLEHGYDLMIHGHTHQRGVRCFNRTVTLNPGTLSNRRCDQPGFALLDCEAWRAWFYNVYDHDDLPIELHEEVDLNDLPVERLF